MPRVLPGGNFRELKVWQRAIELTLAIYRCTEEFPREERFGLTSQIRRAAVSIASNIAEGSGRSSSREYRQFLFMARGSALELQTQLVIAARLGFGNPELLAAAESLSQEVVRMLAAFLRKLQTEISP